MMDSDLKVFKTTCNSSSVRCAKMLQALISSRVKSCVRVISMSGGMRDIMVFCNGWEIVVFFGIENDKKAEGINAFLDKVLNNLSNYYFVDYKENAKVIIGHNDIS